MPATDRILCGWCVAICSKETALAETRAGFVADRPESLLVMLVVGIKRYQKTLIK